MSALDERAAARAEEVSVSDLERKGLDKVKVLREKDLDRMIRVAVEGALADDGRDREALLARARRQMEEHAAEAEGQRAMTARGEAVIAELVRAGEALEGEIRDLEARARAAEEEAERRRHARRIADLRAALARAEALLAAEGEDAVRARLADAERRAQQAGKTAAVLAKRIAAERAAAAARKPRNTEPGKGLDVGTANLVSAVQERDGPLHAALQRNAFIEVAPDALMTSMLTSQGVPYAEIGGKIFVVGDAAFELASVLNRETRRPMARGIVSPAEKDALPVMRLIIERLLGKPSRPGEVCCFSVPADPVDAGADAGGTVYHEGLFKQLLTRLGYDARPIREGHAVVLAELADDDFTGIGVSCGGGMHNVCVAYKAVNVLSFSTARGGDWIDQNVAQVLGCKRAKATAIKEGGVDVRDPKTREHQAVAIYARELIRHTLELIGRRFESTADRPDFPEPVDMVFAGGTALIGGFVEVVREELGRIKFPLPIRTVRVAEDPLRSVAKGCLVMAMSGG